MKYIPDSADIVWITFDPQAMHEHAGRRPAILRSPLAYNSKVGLAILCPFTNQIKGYPFEVIIPSGLMVQGAILSDQVKSIDWKVRKIEFIFKLPSIPFNEVIRKLNTLMGIQI